MPEFRPMPVKVPVRVDDAEAKAALEQLGASLKGLEDRAAALTTTISALRQVADEADRPLFILAPEKVAHDYESAKEFCETVIRAHEEVSSMSDTKPDILTTLGEDLDSAATRLMRKQAVKALREPMAALLMRGLEDDDPALRAKVALFLSGEVGELVLCGMCSVLLGLVPNTPAWVDKLTRELRVHAAASGGDLIADLLLQPLRTIAADFLRGQDAASPLGLPAVERVRAPSAVDVVAEEQALGAGKAGGK